MFNLLHVTQLNVKNAHKEKSSQIGLITQVYLVFRNGGAKAHEFALGLSAGKGASGVGGGNKFICRTSKTLTVPGGHSGGGGPLGSNTMPSSLQQTAALTQYGHNDFGHLTEAQTLDQIRHLYSQLTSQGVSMLANILEKGQPVHSNSTKTAMIDKATITEAEYFALHVDSLKCMCSEDHDTVYKSDSDDEVGEDIDVDGDVHSDVGDSAEDEIGNGHLLRKLNDCDADEKSLATTECLNHEGNNHCVSNCKILDEKRPTQRLDLNDRSKYTKEVSV